MTKLSTLRILAPALALAVAALPGCGGGGGGDKSAAPAAADKAPAAASAPAVDTSQTGAIMRFRSSCPWGEPCQVRRARRFRHYGPRAT